ncbi:MAG: hypothetical protein V4585_04115 [Bacteroidota bacterium]
MNQHLTIIYSELLLVLGVITLLLFQKISSKRFNNYFWYSIISVPIIFFYATIFVFTDNIPFKDDYILLESIYQMKFAPTFMEWGETFFKQVNQHRFGFERTAMWVIYKVFGNENIKAQILIGNAFLIGILYFFIRIFKNLKLTWAYFIPIPLLLFNLTYFENATWGIAAIQNTPIIFFAIITVHLLSINTIRGFVLAILFATITMFTSGNGLAIWAVGGILLLLQSRWKNLLIWFIFAFSLVTFYFLFDYDVISSDKSNLWKHPILNILYILAFWGNIFFENMLHPYTNHYYWDIILCIITGIFLSGIILGLGWKIFKKRFQNLSYIQLTLLGIIAFLACTGLMLVLSRPLDIKIVNGGDILSRRYMLFGAAFISVGYLAYLYLVKENKLLLTVGLFLFIPIGLFLNINSYYTSLPDVYRQQQELILDGYYWKNHKMLLSFGEKYGEKIGYNHPTYMINLINKIDSSGIYKLSEKDVLPFVNLLKSSNSQIAPKFQGTIDTAMSVGSTISQELKERVLFRGKSERQAGDILYFGLKSVKNVFLFPAVPIINSRMDCLKNQSYYSNEFMYETWKAKFPSDIYEIWIIEKDQTKNWQPYFSGKRISL